MRNSSRRYDYYEWNRTSRQTAAQHIKTDTRDQPKPEEPVEEVALAYEGKATAGA